MGVYAGLRPLLAGESDSTSKLSREHAVATPVPGLVIVAGGKYTTYRVMAADAVDVAVRELAGRRWRGGRRGGDPVGDRRGAAARRRRLPGAVEHPVPARRRVRSVTRLGRAPAEPVRVADRRAVRADRGPARARASRWPRRRATWRSRSLYAATHEGALHLDDILARRTRISIETWDRGVAAASEVAALVAPVLGWDEAQVAREVAHYTSPGRGRAGVAGPARRPVRRRRPARGAGRADGRPELTPQARSRRLGRAACGRPPRVGQSGCLRGRAAAGPAHHRAACRTPGARARVRLAAQRRPPPRPSRELGCCAVVSGGQQKRDSSLSSKLPMAISSGRETPSSRAAWRRPMAWTSALTKTALGRSSRCSRRIPAW